MKLFNQFNVLPRYLTAFNYAGLNLNETPQELQKIDIRKLNFPIIKRAFVCPLRVLCTSLSTKSMKCF